MICKCDVWKTGCKCGVAASEKAQIDDDLWVDVMVDYLKCKLQMDPVKDLVPWIDWCNTCNLEYQHVEGCRVCYQCGVCGLDYLSARLRRKNDVE